MCVYSAVVDRYEPFVPWIQPADTDNEFKWPITITSNPQPVLDLKKLQELLEEFKRLVENAKEIDAKTGQPDCVDPEKAKLIDRVIELEKLIANPPAFVIAEGNGLPAGTYRVIGGKLYKAFE